MALSAGMRLGPYEILASLGAGGMGEVYRAKDTKLGREVALKVLPDDFAADPERLARFQREARLLASLSHASIGAIHDVEEVGGCHFLVLELALGEDLSERLKRGPIPVAESIPIARQIAEALEEAHEKGIVHRDLKPGNVKLTPDGRVKILDFGLAKAFAGDASAPSGDLSESPTLIHTGTQAGLILGTAGYMSPEQARGTPVDRRADIWAFGVVLFEMLTGRALFQGATITDVLAGVVREEPDWAALPPATPIAVRHLLRRCLTRDPRQRLQAIAEARIALESPEAEDGAPGPIRAGTRRRLTPVLGLASVACVLLLLGYAAGQRRRGETAGSADEVRFHRLTFRNGTLWSARFAPDGETLVYGAAWDGSPVRLFLTRLDTPDSSPMNLPDAQLLSVSPTGELAVSLGHRFDGFMGEGTLARAPLLGGGARPVLEKVREADWAPDGSALAVVRRVEGLERLEFPVGTVLYQTTGWVSHVRFSPRGDRIAFADHPIWSDDVGWVSVVDLAGDKTELTPFSGQSVRGLAWSPSGEEVWYTTQEAAGVNAIRAVDLNKRQRTLFSALAHVVLYDVSHSGRLLLGQESTLRRVEARVAGHDEPRDFTLAREHSIPGFVSEDGRLVLVSELSDPPYATYLMRADGSAPVRIGDGAASAISPDGKWVVALTPEERRRLLLHPIGTGESREVPNPAGIQVDVGAWLSNGKLAVFGAAAGQLSRGWVLDPEGAEPARAFTDEGVGIGSNNTAWLATSPDGTRVVAADESSTYRIYPLAGGQSERIPGLGEGDLPLQWTDDGKALFVARGGETTWNVQRLDLATGEETPWITVPPGDPAGLRLSLFYITRNGRYWIRGDTRLLVDLYVAEGIP
jgi:Tol biopolymer transport system component